MQQKTFNRFTWTLFIGVLILSFIAWGQTVNWSLGSLTAYQWFPLLGISAWLVMWTHYITGYVRLKSGVEKNEKYSRISGFFVLAFLLLHPGLLALVQFQNNQGLPPESFVNYVGESLRLAVFLGTIGLTIFLSFEFFERAKSIDWVSKYWWLVSIAQSLAMTVIFVHGLRLGTTLGDGWFRIVWIIFGVTLLPCFYLFHKADFTRE